MLRTLFCTTFVMLGSSLVHGQDPYIPYVEWSEPNPPRPASGPNPAAEGGSTAPDGYSPIPQWAGQTRAPIATKQEEYELETVVSGIAQGFASTAQEGMEQPVYFWTPSIAPSGIEFYTGDLFPS